MELNYRAKIFLMVVDLNYMKQHIVGYDPQIGRFHQIDALSDLNVNLSTYAFAQNNPILFSDPYGLDTIRGKLPKDYTPQPGDVWIIKKEKKRYMMAKMDGYSHKH